MAPNISCLKAQKPGCFDSVHSEQTCRGSVRGECGAAYFLDDYVSCWSFYTSKGFQRPSCSQCGSWVATSVLPGGLRSCVTSGNAPRCGTCPRTCWISASHQLSFCLGGWQASFSHVAPPCTPVDSGAACWRDSSREGIHFWGTGRLSSSGGLGSQDVVTSQVARCVWPKVTIRFGHLWSILTLKKLSNKDEVQSAAGMNSDSLVLVPSSPFCNPVRFTIVSGSGRKVSNKKTTFCLTKPILCAVHYHQTLIWLLDSLHYCFHCLVSNNCYRLVLYDFSSCTVFFFSLSHSSLSVPRHFSPHSESNSATDLARSTTVLWFK